MALRQLILVPVLLKSWGPDLYGQWLVVTAIPSFLAMSNLGLGTSAQMRISIDMAGGRKTEVTRVMTTAIIMISAIGVLVSSLVFTVVPYFYRTDLQKVHIEHLGLVLLFLVLSLFLKMLAQPISGFWTGVGRPSFSGHAGNLCSVVELLLSVCVPLAGGSAFVMALSLLSANLLWLGWFVAKSVPVMKKHGMTFSRPDWSVAKDMAVSGLGHQIGPLWQAILFQGSIILANSALGPLGAATWGSLRFLTRSGNQVLELVSQTLGPEFQLALGQNAIEKLRKFFAMGLIASVFFSSAMAIGIVALGPWFFGYWAQGTLPVSLWAWLLMAFALIPFSGWWLAGEFQRAINRPWLLNLWGIAAAVISVGVMWCLRGQGLVGFAIGSLVFEILMVAFIVPISLRFLQLSLISFIGLGTSEILSNVQKSFRSRRLNPNDA